MLEFTNEIKPRALINWLIEEVGDGCDSLSTELDLLK